MPYDIVSLQVNKIEDRAVADPFKWLERAGHLRMRYLETRLLQQTYWILRGREHSPLARVFRNLRGLLGLFAGRGRTVIVGAEPFSALTFLLPWLKRRHTCLYATSWSWQEERFAHRWFGAWRRRIWAAFLRGTVCVSFNPEPCAVLGGFGARAVHIPHPVDTERFHPPATPRPDGPLHVLFVGHLTKIKGLHVLLELIRSRPWTGLDFWIVGRGPFEAQVRELEQAGGPVRYFGQVTDRDRLAELYRQADIFLLPSVRVGRDEEKFGMVLVEAMASGLPLVATDCVGPRQIVTPGRTGLLVPQNDVAALAAALEQLRDQPEQRRAMGAAGCAEVAARYSLPGVAQRWLEAIRLAVAPPAPAGGEA